MKSWLSRIWSSVIPISRKSPPQVSLQLGSRASNLAYSDTFGGLILPEEYDGLCCESDGGIYVRGDSGGVGWLGMGADGADVCLWPPNIPPSIPCFWGAGPLPPNGFNLVALLACFSRSTICFRNLTASFSSENDKPAKQPSISKL